MQAGTLIVKKSIDDAVARVSTFFFVLTSFKVSTV